MPIYEFYCAECNTIFNFFSRRVNTEKKPMCPKCNKRPLERVISRFAILKGGKEKDDMGMPELDETNLKKAMSLMEREAQNINENDPKQVAHLMRLLCDTTGIHLGSGMDESFRRMEAGEDPEKIEEEMGNILNEEDLFNVSLKVSQKSKKKSPIRDETLYYL